MNHFLLQNVCGMKQMILENAHLLAIIYMNGDTCKLPVSVGTPYVMINNTPQVLQYEIISHHFKQYF